MADLEQQLDSFDANERGRALDELIERVKDASDIVEIVSEYVQLKKAGRSFVGLCPFHTEKTPSFNVNPELQIYKCFGCGAGGSVFKFLQEVDRVSFVEAVTFLAQRHGIALPDREADREQNEVADQLYRANELAQKYFHHLLWKDEQGRKALEYLRSRDLTDETIERFGLGSAPPGWDGLLKVAGRRGYPPEVLEKAGLTSRGQRGHYDRFRGRLTFPIANLSGRTIAFGARALAADQEPKYLNSPETAIYHKSSVLYGLNHTREAIRQRGEALVVEGYMDLLRLAQHDIPHTVATSGTALTPEHCRTLARYAQQVVLIFDGDAAGAAASLRGIETLLAAGLHTRAVSLPEGHDPDSYVREKGGEALLEVAEAAGSALDFYLEQLGRQSDLSTLAGKSRAIGVVKNLLARCSDAVRRDLMLREVAQRLSIDEKAIRQELQHDLQRPSPSARTAETEPPPAALPDPPRVEASFFGLLLTHPKFIAPTAQQLDPEAFLDPRSQALARALFERVPDLRSLDLSVLMSSVEDEAVARFISDCAMEGYDEEQVDKQWRDYLLRFRREGLTRRIEEGRKAQQAAFAAGDHVARERITKALDELIQERQELGPDAGGR